MAESIRSLTVKLGYDIDTSGARIFKDSTKDLKMSMSGLVTSIDGLSNAFNKKLKEEGKKMKISAKRILGGVVAAGIATLATMKKTFTAFATEDAAKLALSAQLSDKEFKKVLDTIEKMPKSLKKATDTTDILNSVAKGLDFATEDIDFLLSILPFAIQKSKVLGKSLEEVTGMIYAAGGGDLKAARRLGFTTAEVEKQKQRQGVQGVDYGIEIGKDIVTGLIRQNAKKAEEDYKVYLRSARGAVDGMVESFNKTIKQAGDSQKETIGSAARETSLVIDRFRETVKETDSVIEGVKSALLPYKSLLGLQPDVVRPVSKEEPEKIYQSISANQKIEPFKYTNPLQTTNYSQTSSTQNKTENNFNINITATTTDEKKLSNEISSETTKKITELQNSLLDQQSINPYLKGAQ